MNFFQSIGQGLGRLSRNINHAFQGKAFTPEQEAAIATVIHGAVFAAVSSALQSVVTGQKPTLAGIGAVEANYLNGLLGSASDSNSLRGKLLASATAYESSAVASISVGTAPGSLSASLQAVIDASAEPAYAKAIADTIVGALDETGVATAAGQATVRGVLQLVDQAKDRIANARF